MSVASARHQLRLVGVNGPYSLVLGADAYTALAETSDNGYPVLEHVKKLLKDQIIWAPAIAGAFVLTTRGGDFDLHIGQDVSLGYLSRDCDFPHISITPHGHIPRAMDQSFDPSITSWTRETGKTPLFASESL